MGQGPQVTTETLLDAVNLRILQVLQQDGRLSNVALAEQVGLSPSPCLERVKRLEKAGLITGYHAALDLDRICANILVFAEITLRQHQPEQASRFARAIAALPAIVSAHKVSGPFDYMLLMRCRDVRHYHELSEAMIRGDLNIAKFVGHIALEHTKPATSAPLTMLLQG